MFFNNATDIMVINNTLEECTTTPTGIMIWDNVDNSTFIGNAVRGSTASPPNNYYSAGINVRNSTSANNIVEGNQFENVVTRISDSGTNTKLETNHHRATTNPTVNDDVGDGYEIGTIWINTSTNISYILVDHTLGAANWLQLSYNMARSTPPAACSSSFAGRQFMDTDNGMVYVCDTSNGRNKWLTQDDTGLFGENTGTCNAGSDIGNRISCATQWGSALGPDTATDLGIYIPYPITITGYGFSEDNDTCTSGSMDVEVWGTGSNANDNTYSLQANVATGLTGEAHNSNALNVDVAGGQYIIWGIDNNCGQNIDDWNVILYYRYQN
jgi:hypothetical protein